jgi:hypothetical protein
LLWDQRPDVFAAVAPCGSLPREQLKLTTPKPAFIVSGEKDPLVDIDRQKAAIERVRKLNGATTDRDSVDERHTVYESDQGTPVETLIHRGAHVLPPRAPMLIVNFFRSHEKPKSESK